MWIPLTNNRECKLLPSRPGVSDTQGWSLSFPLAVTLSYTYRDNSVVERQARNSEDRGSNSDPDWLLLRVWAPHLNPNSKQKHDPLWGGALLLTHSWCFAPSSKTKKKSQPGASPSGRDRCPTTIHSLTFCIIGMRQRIIDMRESLQLHAERQLQQYCLKLWWWLDEGSCTKI